MKKYAKGKYEKGKYAKESMPNKTRLATAVALVSTSATLNAAQLDEIIVTAQKREQTLQEVPLSVSVVGSEALDRQNINDVVSLTHSVPSLNFQNGFAPSSSNINIRGVASYAFEGGVQPSVSFVVDGVSYARAGEFVTELADIERVEVLRGPQGTLFGRNATGGAVNIVTKRPGDEFEGSMDVTFTDDEEQLYRLSLGGPLSDTVGMSVSTFYKDRNGHYENVHPDGDDLGGITTWGLRTKLDVDFSDTVNVLFTADYRDADHGFTPNVVTEPDVLPSPAPPDLRVIAHGVVGDAPNLAVAFNPNAPAAERTAELAKLAAARALGQQVIGDPFKINIPGDFPDDQALTSYGFSADLTWELSDELTLKSISSYRDFFQGTTNDVISAPGRLTDSMGGTNGMGLPVPLISSNLDRNHEEDETTFESDYFTQEIRLEYTSDAVDWIAGVFYQDYEELQKNNLYIYIPSAKGTGNAVFEDLPASTGLLSFNGLNNSNELQAWSVFGDITFHLTETVDIFAGVRWSQEEADVDYDTLNYSIVDRAEFDLATFKYKPSDDPGRAMSFDPANGGAIYVPPDLVAVSLCAFAAGKASNCPPGAASPSQYQASEEDGDYSARLGAAWQVTEDINIYASVSRGYVGIGSKIAREADAVKPFLAPTTSEAVEIGIKSQLFDGSMQLNAAVFAQDVSDLQTATLIPGTISALTLNAGDLSIQGFEADVLWQATDWLRVSAGVAYINAEIENFAKGQCHAPIFDEDNNPVAQTVAGGCNLDAKGNPTTDPADAVLQDSDGLDAPNTPDLKYNIGLDIDVPFSDLPFDGYANITYVWQDEVRYGLFHDPLLEQGDYGLLDITLGIVDKEGRYEISVFGKNVTDEHFYEDMTESNGVIGRVFTRSPRGARAYYGLKAKFNF